MTNILESPFISITSFDLMITLGDRYYHHFTNHEAEVPRGRLIQGYKIETQIFSPNFFLNHESP